MSTITRAQHPAAAWPGVKRWFGLEYKQHDQIWSRIFEVMSSDKAYEEDNETVGFGLLSTKNEAGGIVYDTSHQGFTKRYTNITYALGYQVTMEELMDNLYTKLSFKRSGRLARSVNETLETIHANVFNRAFNSSFAGGDGVSMISAAHPTDAGNQSNILATATDLSEAAIEDLCIQIRNAQDARGLKISNMPKCLLVANENMFEATRIVKSVLQNDTANNAVNAIRVMNMFPDGIIVNPYFTDTDAWFIKTDCPDGLTHYNRMSPTFDQDNDFDSKNLKASVCMRFSAGHTDWRQIYGSAGS